MNNRTFEEEIRQNGYLVYTNVGVSMMPLLRQNRDLMVIEKQEGRCARYDAVLYKRKNGQYVLHRILKVRKEDYVICGDNCWRREYGITDEQILGVLTAVVRDGKKMPVTDRNYQRYVHLWCDFYYIRAVIFFMRDMLRAIKRKGKKLWTEKKF